TLRTANHRPLAPKSLLAGVRQRLAQHRFSQVPQLTLSRPVPLAPPLVLFLSRATLVAFGTSASHRLAVAHRSLSRCSGVRARWAIGRPCGGWWRGGVGTWTPACGVRARAVMLTWPAGWLLAARMSTPGCLLRARSDMSRWSTR